MEKWRVRRDWKMSREFINENWESFYSSNDEESLINWTKRTRLVDNQNSKKNLTIWIMVRTILWKVIQDWILEDEKALVLVEYERWMNDWITFFWNKNEKFEKFWWCGQRRFGCQIEWDCAHFLIKLSSKKRFRF